MSRSAVALLAVLCALSAPVLAAAPASLADTSPSAADSTVVDGSAVTVQDGNTTARLTLGEVTASGRDASTVDIGASLALDTARLDERHGEFVVEERIAAAESREQRIDVMEREVDRIADRIVELEEQEQRAYRAYDNGTMGERQLLRTIARYHAEANQLETTLETVSQHASSDGASALSDRAWLLRTEVSALDGPVRTEIASALDGERDPISVYVETGQNGVVFAAIDDDNYLREAYRPDQRNRTADTGAVVEDSDALMESHYPRTWDAAWSTSWTTVPQERIYRGTASHPQGELVSYVDAETQNPYRETQVLALDRLPTEESINETVGETRLTVDRSYASGPMLVTLRVTDSETDSPAVGTVSLDGDPLARTGGDGLLWFVAPSGVFELTITVDGEEFTATMGEWPADETPTATPDA